jgi:hypothetical protein
LKTTGALTAAKPLVPADSAFYGRGLVGAAVRAGADVSVTVRMDPKVKTAITTINDEAWRTIEYTDAVFDEVTGRWISRAEVAEIEFTAFASQKKADRVPGRLVVRRIRNRPEGRARAGAAVGHLAVPRLRQHRSDRSRHGGRGQDPPRARGDRAGPRRPKNSRQRACPPRPSPRTSTRTAVGVDLRTNQHFNLKQRCVMVMTQFATPKPWRGTVTGRPARPGGARVPLGRGRLALR